MPIANREDYQGSAKNVADLYTFLGAYSAYKEECAKAGRRWNDDTQSLYESIVRNRIVPNLHNHDRQAIQWYTLQDYKDTIERIKKNGQTGDPANHVPYDEDTLAKYWHIMRTIVEVVSAEEGFMNVFEEEQETPSNEQTILKKAVRLLVPKSFSVQEELKVAQYLLDNIKNRGEFIVLFLMYALGLRNEEACGVNFGHVQEMEEYPGHYYIIVPQSTENHRNATKLGMKTYNAYRNIPLPELAIKVIFKLRDERIKKLMELRKHDVDISKEPIAYRTQNPLKRCGADPVTRCAKEMFEELGMRQMVNDTDVALRLIRILVHEEQVDIDRLALMEKEPTAYLLRRNFATHMRVLKLSESQLTYIMGHVIEDPQVQRSDFTNERELFEIKKKMDKRPILNTIDMNPRYKIELNDTVDVQEYSQEFIVDPRTKRLVFNGIAKEPGDAIVVTLIQNGKVLEEHVVCHGAPCPHHFDRETDVLKAYHEAFLEATTANEL